MNTIALDPAEEIIFKLLTKILQEKADIYKDIYITGGWVRDKLLGHQSKDMDICVEEAFVKPLVRNIITEFVTVKQYQEYDIVRCINKQTFKVEQEPIKGYEVHVLNLYDTNNDITSVDIRKLKNDSIEADIYTRDFTINSLYFSIKEMKVLDPNTDRKGLEDIQNKILRCVGTLEETFNNSQSRYFRLLRFAVKFNFTPHEDIINHIKGLDFKKDIYVK